jgi:hypothetical protein
MNNNNANTEEEGEEKNHIHRYIRAVREDLETKYLYGQGICRANGSFISLYSIYYFDFFFMSRNQSVKAITSS